MAPTYPAVLAEDLDGGIRILILNRPEKRNAFNSVLARSLADALADASADEGVRVVIVTGAGAYFSSGADMRTFAGQDEGDPNDIPLIGNLHEPLLAVEKPTIAAVNGPAIGMGVTILPYFDMVYAADTATFRTPFVRLGLVLEYGSSYTLPRLIGRQRANELILRGVEIDAATAERWGLVVRTYPADELREAVVAIARDVAAGGPNAVRKSRDLIRFGEREPDFAKAWAEEQRVLATCYGSPEHMQAVMAFLQRKQRS